MIYLSTCHKVKFEDINGYYYRLRTTNGRYDWGICINNMELFLKTLIEAFDNHPEKQLLINGAKREYCYLIQLYSKHRFGNEVGYKEFVYPYLGRLSGKRIVIYGAGDVGKCYWKHAISEGECDVVAWVDKNADQIVKNEMLPINNVDYLSQIEYDLIIVGVADRWQYVAIKNELRQRGIDDNKIEWFPTKRTGLIDYINK